MSEIFQQVAAGRDTLCATRTPFRELRVVSAGPIADLRCRFFVD